MKMKNLIPYNLFEMAKYSDEKIYELMNDFYTYVKDLNDKDFYNKVKQKVENYLENYLVTIDIVPIENLHFVFDNDYKIINLLEITYKSNLTWINSERVYTTTYRIMTDNTSFTFNGIAHVDNTIHLDRDEFNIKYNELMDKNKLWNKLKDFILDNLDFYQNEMFLDTLGNELHKAKISKIKLKREFFYLYKFFMESFSFNENKVKNLFSDDFIDKNIATFAGANNLCRDVDYVVNYGMRIFDYDYDFTKRKFSSFLFHSSYDDLKFLVDKLKNN